MSILECEICCDEFNETVNKPHTLECGHSFCAKCMNGLLNAKKPNCPKCRSIINKKSIEEIPVNFSLLEMLSAMKKKLLLDSHNSLMTHFDSNVYAGFCEGHGNIPLHFYCKTCTKWICSTCVLVNHNQVPAGKCVIQTAPQAIQELKNEYAEKLLTTDDKLKKLDSDLRLKRSKLVIYTKKITERKHELLNELKDVEQKSDNMNQMGLKLNNLCKQIENWKKELRDMIKKLMETSDVNDIEKTVEKLKITSEDCNKWVQGSRESVEIEMNINDVVIIILNYWYFY